MRGKAAYAFKIPKEMTFEQAAALPVVYYTAWYGLVRLSRARKGQTVLIHLGAGGVGQAAIQLARQLGLEIFTTVGSDEKRQLVRDKYGVDEDHIFGSRDLGFVRGIMKMTGRRGVDIVLNSLAGEFLLKAWECLAPSGHFVEIGLKDMVDNTRLGMRPFLRGASFSSFNMKDVWDGQPELMTEIVQGTTPYLVEGHCRAAEPLVSYSLPDLVKALRLLQSGKHTGKLLLNWTLDVQIPVLRFPVPALRLERGVFLLVGGMGGLGRSIARMLVSHGDIKEWEKVWGIREDSFLALVRLSMQADEMGIGARVVTGLGTRAGSLAA